MKIFLTGGTGFIGSALSAYLEAEGHQLTILTRRQKTAPAQSKRRYVIGDPQQTGEWQGQISGHEVVINLAGASIFRRWTAANRKVIRESRLLSTANVVSPLLTDKGHCKLLLSASAVGYYGLGTRGPLPEGSQPGSDFLADLALYWEKEAQRAAQAGIRVACCRFGVVLGAKGGALAQMLPAFRLGLGSPLGSGKQPFPWIHIDDLCRAMLHIIEHPEHSGPFNFVAPRIPTNREFSKCLGRALHRPVWLPAVPSFVLRLALGEMANIVLDGQNAPPEKLLQSGFRFLYEDCESALRAIVD